MRIATLIIVACLIGLSARSQEYIMHTQLIGPHEGLADHAVNAVAYAPDGYLWIGTESGLNRFDGFHFIEFNKTNTSLQSDFIRSLTFIENGDLIVLANDEYLQSRPEGIYTVRSDHTFERHLAFDSGLKQGIGSRIFGLVGTTFYVLLPENVMRIYNVLTREWKSVEIPAGFTPDAVKHGFAFGTAGGQARIVDLDQDGAWVDKSVLLEKDADLALIWGLRERIAPLTLPNWVMTSVVDRNRGLIWVMSQAELTALDFNGHVAQFRGRSAALRYPRKVNDLTIGPDGTTYVATLDGLHLIRTMTQHFRTYAYASDPGWAHSGDSVFSTRGIVGHEGKIYFAQNDILYAQDPNSDTATQLLVCEDKRRFFPVLSTGDVLLTGRTALYAYDLAKGASRIIIDSITAGVGPVWSMYRKDNTLFLGCGRGVLTYNFQELMHDRQLSVCNENPWRVNFTYQFRDIPGYGLFYVTADGLFLSDTEDGCNPRPIRFGYQDGKRIPFHKFTSLWDDEDGTFWATSLDGGMVHFRLQGLSAEVIRILDRDDGLPTNTMYAVYPDDHGGMWMSTDLGLVQLHTADWSYRVYTTEDGLPHNEFNRLSHYRDANGNLYFGGLNGVVAFTPSDFYETVPNRVKLNLLSYAQHSSWDDTIIDLTEDVRRSQRITFHAGDKFMRFELGLEDFFRTGDHQYEYRIEGLHDEWQIAQSNGFLISVLPYGEYVLKVRARDAFGKYSGNELHFVIRAVAPFYLRWWFFALVGLGVLLTIREYLLSRTRRIQNLERVVGERTAEISRQSEALLELQQVRSRFFANISHELRTPLTLIKGPVESLIQRDHPDDERKYLDIIQSNTQQLQARIEDLLSLSKADSGQLRVHPISIEIQAFLERLIDNFSAKAGEQDVVMQILNTLPADAILQADQRKLEQILSNFLSNAIKYSPPNGIISISCTAAEGKLKFSVVDQGVGIPPSDTEKVFERFYQGKAHKGGSGIGLALCKELANVMQGRVWVESNPGSGSNFCLEIPWIEGYDASHQTAPAEIVPGTRAVPEDSDVVLKSISGAHTILIVEDNAAMRTFLSMELRQFNVLTAQDGVDAMEQLGGMIQSEALPDLIISDVMMPRMDGFELLQQIKDTEQLAAIPVIMLTARAGLEDKLQALRVGVHDYITKPFSSDELRVRIGNLLAQAAAKEVDTAETGSPGMDHGWLAEVEQRIRAGMGERDFSVARLADEMHVSESQLFRRIKAYTGLSPGKYLREVRLFCAKARIESGEHVTVAMVSAEVGFEDAAYFSRIYFQRFGYKPIERL